MQFRKHHVVAMRFIGFAVHSGVHAQLATQPHVLASWCGGYNHNTVDSIMRRSPQSGKCHSMRSLSSVHNA